MYIPIPSQPSCASAWIAAVETVENLPGHEAHNVIINVQNPIELNSDDHHVIGCLNGFLEPFRTETRPLYPVSTVANTIFPRALYQQFGAPEFYKVYMEKVFPRIKRGGDWGRYFERMIAFPNATGDGVINPLDELVTKMKRSLAADRTYKNIYEMTLYNPHKDANKDLNRQCLSFLSFKLVEGAKLNLTAMYRNHYYISRLLGNLIGLGQLMQFVAQETGIKVGELTVVSTHAVIDPVGPRAGIQALIEKCKNPQAQAA